MFLKCLEQFTYAFHHVAAFCIMRNLVILPSPSFLLGRQCPKLSSIEFAILLNIGSCCCAVTQIALKQSNYDIAVDSFSGISESKTGLAHMEQSYFMRNQVILPFFIRFS